MKITFFDRQNASNPLNTTVITTTTELLDILNGLKGRSAFFCEPVGENAILPSSSEHGPFLIGDDLVRLALPDGRASDTSLDAKFVTL